jgi:hypothetical protein
VRVQNLKRFKKTVDENRCMLIKSKEDSERVIFVFCLKRFKEWED